MRGGIGGGRFIRAASCDALIWLVTDEDVEAETVGVVVKEWRKGVLEAVLPGVGRFLSVFGSGRTSVGGGKHRESRESSKSRTYECRQKAEAEPCCVLAVLWVHAV